MVSVGRDRSDDPVVFYVAGDHYSETLRLNRLSPEAARAAMRHFVATGELSRDWSGKRSSCCFEAGSSGEP
jgi:hypothetical protein